MIDILRGILASPEFTALLLTTFAVIVTAIVGLVALPVRTFIARNISAKDLALLTDIAVVAVRYVDQKFHDLNGESKLAQAVLKANDLIAKYGLKVTINDLLTVIEAAVNTETYSPYSDLVDPPLIDEIA